MEPQALVELLERSPTEARGSLIKHRGLPGLSRAYCTRVLELYASDSGAALALSAHWRRVLTYGDEPAPSHRVGGIYHLLRGRWSECAKSFVRAGETATDPVERLSFQVGAVDAMARTGLVDDAVALGRTLAQGLDDLGKPGLAARVRFNLGSAMYWQDRMEEARNYLQDSIEPMKAGGFLADAAAAQMALSLTHTYRGRLQDARHHAEEARRQAQELNLARIVDECDQNLAHVDLLAGNPDRALDRLLDLRSRFEATPAVKAASLEFLGDAYHRLNLWPEAIDAYREALGYGMSLVALHRAHLYLGLGQALLASGRAEESLKDLRTAARLYARLKNHSWHAAALSSQARAMKRMGRLSAARSLSRASIIKADAGFNHAESLLLLASLDGQKGLITEAEKLVRANGYMGLLWEVHHQKALAAEGAARLKEFRLMFESILAGRIEVSSLSSRSSYLRNKSEAVQDYLGELLDRPTRSRVAEAISLVERTRSVTLLDELLAGRDASLTQESLDKLRDLRKQLVELGVNESPESPSRRGIAPAIPLATIQRRWIDLTRDIRMHIESVVPASTSSSLIYAGTRQGMFLLDGGRPTRLPIRREDLEKKLKWLSFELLSPLADRDEDCDEASDLIKSLTKTILPDYRGGDISVCPEGLLWRVPWAACVSQNGDSEVELRLHPSLGGNMHDKIARNPRVALCCSNAPDLPHARQEAKAFLELFPYADVFTSGNQLREGLSGTYDLIHVVAHAKHRASNPMFTSVLFSDGPVFATEIARSDLRCSLVTLSACETGMMSTANRDEPDGLARAFLARGASNVIASMWPLDDEAATKMFSSFFDRMRSGASAREALAEARQTARKWRKHPYFWGSLALYGGYGK